MDSKLVKKLKAYDVLPPELDKEAKTYYEQHGINPSELEFHYHCPGRPSPDETISFRIISNVRALHNMEALKDSETPEYKRLENSIQRDLKELEKYLQKLQPKLVTGVVGVYRDPWGAKQLSQSSF